MSFKHSLVVLGTFVSVAACQASFQAGAGTTPSATPATGGAPAATTAVPTAAPTSTDAATGGAPAATTTAAPVAKSTIAGGKVTPQGALGFDSGKAILLSNSENEAILDDLKLVLDQNPTITQMRIEGYADGAATADANLELSGQRALVVKKALIDKGVAAERLIAVGFGDKKPKAGQNQRIEFKVAVLNGKNYLNQEPTGGGKKFE